MMPWIRIAVRVQEGMQCHVRFSVRLTKTVAAQLRGLLNDPRLETVHGLEMTLRYLGKWRSQLISNTLKAKTDVVLALRDRLDGAAAPPHNSAARG